MDIYWFYLKVHGLDRLDSRPTLSRGQAFRGNDSVRREAAEKTGKLKHDGYIPVLFEGSRFRSAGFPPHRPFAGMTQRDERRRKKPENSNTMDIYWFYLKIHGLDRLDSRPTLSRGQAFRGNDSVGREVAEKTGKLKHDGYIPVLFEGSRFRSAGFPHSRE